MRRAISIFLVLSCASSQAPPGFLPTAEQAQREAFGGWIVIEAKGDWKITGELIAISKSEVDVLIPQTPHARLLRLSMDYVSKMHFESYRTQAGRLSLWTSFGTLSTIGNGRFLVFTAPLFIIVGAISAAAESRASFIEYPDGDFSDVWKFARFPQGMPPGADECLLVEGHPCVVPDAATLPDFTEGEMPDAAAPPDATRGPDALTRPRRFEFISDGPYHQSGRGEWVITIDGNDLRIVHNFRMFESRETGPVALTDEELRALWTRLAVAQLDSLPAPAKNASDESLMTFDLDGKKFRAEAFEARHDWAVRKVLRELEVLVERYAGEHPNLQ